LDPSSPHSLHVSLTKKHKKILWKNVPVNFGFSDFEKSGYKLRFFRFGETRLKMFEFRIFGFGETRPKMFEFRFFGFSDLGILKNIPENFGFSDFEKSGCKLRIFRFEKRGDQLPFF